MGFRAPPWLFREHIALEERAVERACTIGEDGYAHVELEGTVAGTTGTLTGSRARGSRGAPV